MQGAGKDLRGNADDAVDNVRGSVKSAAGGAGRNRARTLTLTPMGVGRVSNRGWTPRVPSSLFVPSGHSSLSVRHPSWERAVMPQLMLRDIAVWLFKGCNTTGAAHAVGLMTSALGLSSVGKMITAADS